MKKLLLILPLLILFASLVSANWVLIDDFNDGSFNTTMWATGFTGVSGSVSESSGILTIDGGTGTGNYQIKLKDMRFAGSKRYRALLKRTTTNNDYARWGLMNGTFSQSDGAWHPSMTIGWGVWMGTTLTAGKLTINNTGIGKSGAVTNWAGYYNWTMILNTSGVYIFENETLITNITTDPNYDETSELMPYFAAASFAATDHYDLFLDAVWYWVEDTLPPPTSSNFQNNASTVTKINGVVNWSIDFADETGLSGYIFAHNNTGTLTNGSYVAISGTPTSYFTNNTITITKAQGNNICGQFWFNDTNNNINQTDLSCFTVANTAPLVSNIVWRTAGGFTSGTRIFGQTIAEINATCTESGDNDLIGCNITVTDPDSNTIVNNQPMGNISSNYNYTKNIELNKVGTWTISVTGYDGTDTTSDSTTIEVEITLPTIFDGIYAYDYENLVNEDTIKADMLLYDYDTIGQTINWSTFNTTFSLLKQYINYSKENHSIKTFITIYFDGGNYSTKEAFTNSTCSQINQNFTDFKSAPYDEAITFILMRINNSQNFKVNFTNSIAECLVNATGNKFPIYVNYSNSSLDTNWVSTYSLNNITALTNQSMINQELKYLRTSTSLTRIYYNLISEVRALAKRYHDEIITKIRGTPIAITLSNSTQAEISNGDLVIFNNETIATTKIYNSSGAIRIGKDVWDSTSKTYIESINDGLISVTIPALSFVNLYFDDIDHLTLSSVWASSTTSDLVYGWNKTGSEVQATYSIVGANDAMFFAYDPSYGQNNQFMIHYEWINTSYVTNYSGYGAVIIADKNGIGINKTINTTSSTFGYISVADYADTDEWETNKKNNISEWIDIYGIHIFLDGLDTAIMGDNFGTRFKSLVDFIEVEKNSSCIANDYTSYSMVGVGGLCMYDMKESFCGRWGGSVGSPTYSWETFSVDLERAKFARTNGDAQIAMAFGDINDYNKVQYCYAEFLVLYGTSNNNLYKYGQPNFQLQQEIFTFDPGSQLENTWTEVNSSYFSRKFGNGKVWINPEDHTWNIENNRVVNNLTLSFKVQIYAGSPPDSTPISIDVNGHSIPAITYDEIGSSTWDFNTVTRNISSLYNKSGRYVVRLFSQTPINPAGLNIYRSTVNRSGVFSFHENSVNNPPEIGGTWTAYGRSGQNEDYETSNYMINLALNDTVSSEIDNGITDITQTNISDGLRFTNITINSTKSYDVEVWGDVVILSGFVNMSYWNGTEFKKVNPLETDTCDSLNPSFGSTTIDGEVHKACFRNDSEVYSVRFAPPSLSERLYQVLLNSDTTPPLISDVKFFALNSSKDVIGIDENSFNFSNLADIEYMLLNFTLSDATNILGDIDLFFTANGTNACSLGNNQSSTCYNSDNGIWVQFRNGTVTSTYNDVGGGASGDRINCTYIGTDLERKYSCEIDEHYNPNVYKHYPLNFSDIKYQDGANFVIKQGTVWKINVSSVLIPTDAIFYKLDFRLQPNGNPTQPVLAYLCNTSFTNDTISSTDKCRLVASKLPSQLQDDGTKFRGLFQNNLTQVLGDIGYVVITSDEVTYNYSMKTYKYLGTEDIIAEISTNDGGSYTKLSDGYETELNINWFYNGTTTSNTTQFLAKIFSSDTLSNSGNSSIQTMSWKFGELNKPPIVDIIVPFIGADISGTISINWTTSDPNGDSYTTNITLNDVNIADTLSDSISNFTFDSNTVADGKYNITVESCENTTGDLFCGNDTHEITITNDVPTPPTTPPTTGGGISPSSTSGGCWGLARAYDTCYIISAYGECLPTCQSGFTCNLDYDFDSLNGDTLDYCIEDITPVTTIKKPKDIFNIIKEKVQEVDERIEQGLENIFKIDKPPRGRLEMFISYSYLRFKENVIEKIFFGSWIVFSIFSFLSTVFIIEVITKVKKKKKIEKRKF